MTGRETGSTSGVTVFPSQIEEHLLACAALAPHCENELTRPGRMDQVRVTVECRSGTGDDASAQDGRRLAERIRTHIGISISIEVRAVGTIARSEGKAVRLVDRRPKA